MVAVVSEEGAARANPLFISETNDLELLEVLGTEVSLRVGLTESVELNLVLSVGLEFLSLFVRACGETGDLVFGEALLDDHFEELAVFWKLRDIGFVARHDARGRLDG